MNRKMRILTAALISPAIFLAACEPGVETSSSLNSSASSQGDSSSQSTVETPDLEDALQALNECIGNQSLADLALDISLDGSLNIAMNEGSQVIAPGPRDPDGLYQQILTTASLSFDFGGGLSLSARTRGLDGNSSSEYLGEANLAGDLYLSEVYNQNLYTSTDGVTYEYVKTSEVTPVEVKVNGLNEVFHLRDDKVYIDLSEAGADELGRLTSGDSTQWVSAPNKIVTPEVGFTGSLQDQISSILPISGDTVSALGSVLPMLGDVGVSVTTEGRYEIDLDLDPTMAYTSLITFIVSSSASTDWTEEQIQAATEAAIALTSGTYFEPGYRTSLIFDPDGSYVSLATGLSGAIYLNEAAPDGKNVIRTGIEFDDFSAVVTMSKEPDYDLSWKPDSEDDYYQIGAVGN